MFEDENSAFLRSVRNSNRSDPVWFCCSPQLSDWVIDEGARLLKPPASLIKMSLSEGGPTFLMSFLGVANPSLPLDRIVEGDLEPLIQELSSMFDSEDDDEWAQAGYIAGRWFPGKDTIPPLVVAIGKGSTGDRSQIRSSLSALRLAAFYSHSANLIVVDPVDALAGLSNSYEDGSGNVHFIYQVVRLGTLEPT